MLLCAFGEDRPDPYPRLRLECLRAHYRTIRGCLHPRCLRRRHATRSVVGINPLSPSALKVLHLSCCPRLPLFSHKTKDQYHILKSAEQHTTFVSSISHIPITSMISTSLEPAPSTSVCSICLVLSHFMNSRKYCGLPANTNSLIT